MVKLSEFGTSFFERKLEQSANIFFPFVVQTAVHSDRVFGKGHRPTRCFQVSIESFQVGIESPHFSFIDTIKHEP